jgi:hypothetical protein
MMGFACPGCGLRDPGVWGYTIFPWLCGAMFLTAAGWLYHRAALASPNSSVHMLSLALQKRRLYSSVAVSLCLSACSLLAVFIVLGIVGSWRR